MDSFIEEPNYQSKPNNPVNKTTSQRWLTATDNGDGEEECDVEAWETLSKGFKEAQTALDQNRLLIQQVNENHQSKIHDNLVKNVKLIQEINGNISKVSSVYSNLSVSFSKLVHQRRVKDNNINNNNNNKVEITDS